MFVFPISNGSFRYVFFVNVPWQPCSENYTFTPLRLDDKFFGYFVLEKRLEIFH